jgi:hypothetical protein
MLFGVMMRCVLGVGCRSLFDSMCLMGSWEDGADGLRCMVGDTLSSMVTEVWESRLPTCLTTLVVKLGFSSSFSNRNKNKVEFLKRHRRSIDYHRS